MPEYLMEEKGGRVRGQDYARTVFWHRKVETSVVAHLRKVQGTGMEYTFGWWSL